MPRLAVLVGSLRKDSINKKLALNLVELGKGVFDAAILPLDDLPMFSQDLEIEPPAAVTRLKQGITSADAVLLVTPEYNRSVPAVMKNTVDWASRPSGAGVWGGKPVACCGISPGPVGTAVAQFQLRGSLTMLGALVYSKQEIYLSQTPDFFDAQGVITAERTRTFLRGFLAAFAEWAGAPK